MKKLEELCKYEDKLSQKVYLLEHTSYHVRMLFKARTRMLPTQNNYKNKYKENGNNKSGTVCQRCEEDIDSERHMIEECPSLPRLDVENNYIRYQHSYTGTKDKKDKLARRLCKHEKIIYNQIR